MWQAKLLEVIYDLNKAVDGVKMSVELFHSDGRTASKIYTLWVDELSEINLTSIKAQVQADLDRLAKLDYIITSLSSKIGKVM
jgi:hypothetical protein